MNYDVLINFVIAVIAGGFSVWSARSAIKANRLLEETKLKFALQTYSREVTREKVESMIDALTSEIREMIRSINEGKEYGLSIMPNNEFPKLLVSYGTSKAMIYYSELLKLIDDNKMIDDLVPLLVCYAGMIQQLREAHTGIYVSIEDILKVYLSNYHSVEEEVNRCISKSTNAILN